MPSLRRIAAAAGTVTATTAAALTLAAAPASAAPRTVCGNAAADQAVQTGRYVVIGIASNRAVCPSTGNGATFTINTFSPTATQLTVCSDRGGRWVPAGWVVSGQRSYDTPPCDLGGAQVVIEKL